MIRALRLAALVARYTVQDVAAIARQRVHRAVDELLHGAPEPCCRNAECWAAEAKQKERSQ